MNDLAMVGAFAGLGLAVFAPRKNRRTGRIVFWSGSTFACVFVFLMAFPPDWRSGAGMSLFAACAMVFIAYTNTPFLQIRGRIYAFSREDRRPDRNRDDAAPQDNALRNVREPYGGGVTAAKSWWRAALMTIVFVFSVVMFLALDESPWFAAVSAIAIMLVALVFGHRDAVLGNSLAAGQRAQFVLISVVTVGVFAALYLCAYEVARRVRPHQGRHS